MLARGVTTGIVALTFKNEELAKRSTKAMVRKIECFLKSSLLACSGIASVDPFSASLILASE
jgi:hypothetical protein